MKTSTRESIDRYVKDGVPPGDFLRAVLTNDLFGAVSYADSENLRDLHEICSYIWNQIPANSWGSRSVYKTWIKTKALLREEPNLQFVEDETRQLQSQSGV